MTEALVDLLRHGEVPGGACFRGSRDDALSEQGWEQMRRAVADCSSWTRVLSSPARRCLDFATHLAERRGLALKVLEPLRERHFGAWEGLAADRIPLDQLSRFWDDPAGFTPPGAEPFGAFRERVLDAWDQVLEGLGPHSLIVTHGGVIRVLVARVLQMPAAATLLIEVPHACLTRLRINEPPGRPSLVFHRAP